MKISAEVARKTVLEKLKKLSVAERLDLSQRICERAIHALKAVPVRSIALYRSLPSEVNLSWLEKHYHETGTELCYPRVSEDSDFRHVPDPGHPNAWSCAGSFKVEEPGAHHRSVDSERIDCIVVPGLAFGEHGERVGRGKGHYDRLLEGVSAPLRLVLAFDFQLFEALEQNAWDQPVHWIMTEKRELKLR